ncbi:hypothetical protein GE061_005629 [Apolygus lucorum]|uniref:SOCS box domain-containing protein n=1 Tax=Apolygus lucorum TaxID=248454 RepID=A0A8S9WWR5_APOLU|nr:hypothetical protein GE061_005629 [Apolygus lucorum]
MYVLNKVFLDRSGAKYSSILLRRPLLRKAAPLQHLARLKVNELMKNGDTVPNLHALPSTLRQYLKEYPYAH